MLTIDDAKLEATIIGGKCLSETYISYHKKLHWVCDKGHKWKATLSSVRNGSWCQHCCLPRLKQQKEYINEAPHFNDFDLERKR